MKKMLIEKTKKGYPAFWEGGGSYTNTGEATIIANKDGQPKKAIYVRGRGELANAHHALIILEKGDHIIDASHHREDFEIAIYEIVELKTEETHAYAVVEQINRFSMGEWDAELPAYLEAAVQAAMQKATCYHCRVPHFIE
jgi:hypothetical protein